MTSLLAAIRPDSWNFPLLLHIVGAAVFFGAVLTAVASSLTADRTAHPDLLRRIAFRSLLFVGAARLHRDAGRRRVALLEGVR